MGFLSLQKFVNKKHQQICGLDEVGRGSWAGPLVSCALIFKKHIAIKGCADSKKLTALKRQKIFKILQNISFYGVGIVKPKEVDKLGIITATNLSFTRALKNLLEKEKNIKPDFLLIDGKDKLILPYRHKTIIKGDEKLKIIACASIIAKVIRDHMMQDYAQKYPHYGFERHKGYGTPFHLQALEKYGICALHRKSFKPIRQFSALD